MNPLRTWGRLDYVRRRAGARRSAEQMVPLVLGLVHPKSVVDIGCGTGTWLAVFKEHGVEEILGVDGDYVDRSLLEVPQDKFMPADLRKPFSMDRKFDLVVSLEVAEHIPEECANDFVESLLRLGDIVLFAAAAPHQGGLYHVNERWPDYWVERFSQRGYVAIDALRKRIWRNDSVQFWYRQNTLFFVKKESLAGIDTLSQEFSTTWPEQLSIVHPELYELTCGEVSLCRRCPRRAAAKFIHRLRNGRRR